MIEKLIKKFRLENQLSQRGLAEKTGIKQPMIARWESGEDKPSKESVAKLAKALGVDIKVFYTVPSLDDQEIKTLMKKVSELSEDKKLLVEGIVNSLTHPDGFDKKRLRILGENISSLTPADQIHVEGLIRRLSTTE